MIGGALYEIQACTKKEPNEPRSSTQVVCQSNE